MFSEMHLKQYGKVWEKNGIKKFRKFMVKNIENILEFYGKKVVTSIEETEVLTMKQFSRHPIYKDFSKSDF